MDSAAAQKSSVRLKSCCGSVPSLSHLLSTPFLLTPPLPLSSYYSFYLFCSFCITGDYKVWQGLQLNGINIYFKMLKMALDIVVYDSESQMRELTALGELLSSAQRS